MASDKQMLSFSQYNLYLCIVKSTIFYLFILIFNKSHIKFFPAIYSNYVATDTFFMSNWFPFVELLKYSVT